MSISLVILVITYTVIVFLNKEFRGEIFDAFFFVITPYVAIIFINNIFMTEKGFYKISDGVIWIHIISMILLYIGSVFGQNISIIFTANSSNKKIKLENISTEKLDTIGIFCVLFVMIGKILLVREYGFIGSLSRGDTIKMISIFNHVTLLLYPIVILLYEQFLDHKRKGTLCLIVASYVLIFSSFVKYHVISLFLSEFIYI